MYITKKFKTLSEAEKHKEKIKKKYHYVKITSFPFLSEDGDYVFYFKDKKRKIEMYEFTIPNWALSSLVNGDYSGLEDDDIEKINRFTDKLIKKYGTANLTLDEPEGKDDLGFRYSNDIDNMGSNCTRMYLRVENK